MKFILKFLDTMTDQEIDDMLASSQQDDDKDMNSDEFYELMLKFEDEKM